MIVRVSVVLNRPFYRYDGHIELIAQWGISTIRYTRISIFARFSSQFFFKFSKKKIVMGKKKIVVQCLDLIMISFSPRNIHWRSLFARKARVNTERVPHGHPIILLKSNKFNMATASVKRSVGLLLTVIDVSTTFAVVIFKVSCFSSVDDIKLWLLTWLDWSIKPICC